MFEYSLIVLIGRELGPGALGGFTLALTVLQVSGFVSILGLNTAGQRYVPIYRKEGDNESLTGLTLLCLFSPLVVGSIASLLLFYGLRWMGLFGGFSGSELFQILLIGIPLFAMLRAGEGVTLGFKETKYAVYIRDLGQSGSALVLTGIAVALFGSVQAVAIAYVSSLFVGTVLSVVFLYQLGSFSGIRGPDLNLSETYTYSLPVAMAALSGELLMYTDYLMLGVFVAPDRIGIYKAAFSTAVLITFALVSISSIFPSIASELYHSNEMDALDDLYTVITKWVTYLTAFAMLFFFVFSGEILQIFGEGYTQAKTVLIIVVIGQAINNFVGPAGYLLLMSDNERIDMMNNVVASVVNVVLNFVLIQEFGILGAAIATSFSLSLLSAIRLIEVRVLLDVWPYSGEYVRGLVPLGVALVAMLLGNELGIPPLPRMLVTGSFAGIAFLLTAIVVAYTEKDRLLVTDIQ